MLIATAIRSAAIVLLATLGSAAAQAGPFKDLHDFTASPDGREPAGGLTPWQGMLYGTTNAGGAVDAGTVYRLDPRTGKTTVLYSFTGDAGGQSDGTGPEGEMAVAGKLLYGTTSFGGQFSAGTVFSFNPTTGQEVVLYSFGAGTDGAIPAAGPIIVGNTLFGTTSQGGTFGLGTVFAMDLTTNIETLLHEFSGSEDGATPSAPLTFANGLLYGTTFFGGASNVGTVFSVHPSTKEESVIHAFSGPSFSGNPAAGVVFHNGFLFGTTAHGGRHCSGGCGTVYRVDPSTGKKHDVYRFAAPLDGEDPEGGLVIHKGTLYGTTVSGGRGKAGTIFSIDLSTDTKTTLHDFRFTAGANPGTLTWLKGSLYGTTHGGGAAGQGTVFQFTPL